MAADCFSADALQQVASDYPDHLVLLDLDVQSEASITQVRARLSALNALCFVAHDVSVDSWFIALISPSGRHRALGGQSTSLHTPRNDRCRSVRQVSTAQQVREVIVF